MSLAIEIFTFGKIRQDFVRQGENTYLPRLRGHWNISFHELDSSKFNKLTPTQLVDKEADLLTCSLPKSCYLIALDERGKKMSSPQLANFLQDRMNSGDSKLAFVIGGAYGLSPRITCEAKLTFSLSDLTFTYQMSRLILIEQIYRAYTIVKGLPYQK